MNLDISQVITVSGSFRKPALESGKEGRQAGGAETVKIALKCS
jgi:hypothetical protein